MSKEDLEQTRLDCLSQSEQAVCDHPREFREIKNVLTYILNNQIDINEYFETARSLAELLKKMGEDTIFFQYFHENIHPRQLGRARFLRILCADLFEQIINLNKWRASKKNLTLVK
ncbi:MAG: hypothetical protein GY866_00145 [Proteobacteria bacterium]|nr:hypothetical protein [Pseudomonadota bacterium]